MTWQEALTKAVELIREGKQQEADDLLTNFKEAEAAKPAPDDPPPPPRTAQDIVKDIFNELVTHLGSPPSLVALYKELLQYIEKL